MLKYMRHACGVRRIRLEADTEYIVLIVPRYMQVVRSRLVMLEVQRRQLKLWYMLHSLQCKAMQLASRLRELLEVGYGGI